jgi:diguanylate cyclase (GGDEF)-like protein/PAS domain S-box-containing protein
MDGTGRADARSTVGRDAVARAELRRARHAVFGGELEASPTAHLARQLARASAFSAVPADRPSGATTAAPGPERVPLPSAPALLCDEADAIVRVNPALLRLTGRTAEELIGRRLRQLVVGPDADARLVRADGTLVRVRVVRWDLPGYEVRAVLLVELGEVCTPNPGRTADRRWTAELERLARVGTWSYELATAQLRRSDTLDDLYRSVGVDPDAGIAPLEGEQVARLCEGLRSGTYTRDHHVELAFPGERRLDCRAEVECTADGAPVRLVGVVRDVSAQRTAEGRVRHAGQRFADLMALVPCGVALVDPAGRIVDANGGFCRLLDVRLERLRGLPAAVLGLEPRDRLRTHPPAVDPAEDGAPVEPVPLRRGDGTTVWCEVDVSPTTADDGAPLWLVSCADVGEQRRAAELLRSAGTVDGLTRLPNRTAALEMLDRLLAGPDRDRVAVVCADIDDFQRVNSSLGHEAGDDLLVTIAGRLQRGLPLCCTAGRLAGDEFVVICSDTAEMGGPEVLARTVAELLRSSLAVHGRSVEVTASVGLAVPPPRARHSDPDGHAADLLRNASAAMHDAKRRQPRGGIGMATDGVVTSAASALELEAELRAAIAGDGLRLDYQPVVGPDGAVLSAEALVRWPHAERGVISPAAFLPVAQRSGLLRELDLWVLRTAAREAAGWATPTGPAPAVAVNLAGLLPGEPDFLAAVTDAVTASGLAWERLVLELVETSMVALPPHAVAAMAELVGRGVRFAVDDFGTGYSSLARLKTLPAQIVKLDRAFVTGVADDPADLAVARAVVDMARAMQRRTVAEGVETAEQFAVLRGIGVDAFQGWLFSRALPAAQLRALLAAGQPPTRPA